MREDLAYRKAPQAKALKQQVMDFNKAKLENG
jgi:hypothetical protein